MAAPLAYVAGVVVVVWGVAHAAPTRQVVAGFAPITADNRRIVVQEWLAEAFTMWGIAAMVIVVTAAGGGDAGARVWVYRVAAGLLIALAALTALTGARTAVVWFKICPVLLGGSAVLLLAASMLYARDLGLSGPCSGLRRGRRGRRGRGRSRPRRRACRG